MNPSRLVFAIVAGCCLLRPLPLAAQDGAPPFVMEKQYSADMTITMKDGTAIPSKNYVDGDKMRNEMTMNGMEMATIVRKDKQKIYQIIVPQKMIMEMPYSPDKLGGEAASFGLEGKFELVGPETVAGVACSKYKVTSVKEKQVYFVWLDLEHKVPVQMAAADGAFTVTWKKYKVGPQNAALFEPPSDYQTVAMPSIPGIPGQ